MEKMWIKCLMSCFDTLSPCSVYRTARTSSKCWRQALLQDDSRLSASDDQMFGWLLMCRYFLRCEHIIALNIAVIMTTMGLYYIWGRAVKSLARPGRKQATATKLGIYSTLSPRKSIHFLARCSNFCKPLKKIQNLVRPTRSSRHLWPPYRTKNGELLIVLSVQGTGSSPTGPDPENRVGDRETGSPCRPVSSGFQVPGEPGHCRERTRPPWWPSLCFYPAKCPSIAPAEMSNNPRW